MPTLVGINWHGSMTTNSNSDLFTGSVVVGIVVGIVVGVVVGVVVNTRYSTSGQQ